ncbi:MAG TPA: AraC family transcriptional regulator [Methylomirabilota bacterium]|nr:AraC family transcriptional regulator [Methylomirabilota bacterium]
MHAKPMISVAAATGLLEAISAAGANADEILQGLGLSRSVFSQPEGFIPSSSFAQLLEEAARSTGDNCFGLHFGEQYNPKNIGPLVYAVLNSPTIGAALVNAERYLHVYNQAEKWSFTVQGNRGYVSFLLADLGVDSLRQSYEHGMAIVLNTVRMMVGSQWSPEEVQFAHEAPAQTSEHIRVFRCPVVFGCESNAMVIEHDFLERQVPAADKRLYRIVRGYLEHVWSEMPREESLVSSVRKGVAESLKDGDPNLTLVARKMAMSPRTLQRRLKEYGVEFKKLVDDTRRRCAIDYLRDRKNTLTGIAFLLGYSELSAFNRAFKRWTGSTPLDYRRGIAR